MAGYRSGDWRLRGANLLTYSNSGILQLASVAFHRPSSIRCGSIEQTFCSTCLDSLFALQVMEMPELLLVLLQPDLACTLMLVTSEKLAPDS